MNTPAPTQELEVLDNSHPLPALRSDLPSIWQPYQQKLEELRETALKLTVTNSDQKYEMKIARATRLELKSLRIEVEKKRKELGEDLLKQTQRINGAAKEIREALETLEERLLEQEQFAEREAAKKLLELTEQRTAELNAVGSMVPASVGTLSDAEFAGLLADAKALAELKAERERQAEADRLAKIEADRLERERIEAENERLKAEAAEAERLAKIEADRIAAERAEERRLAKIEADKLEAERAALEAKMQEERDAAAKAAKAAADKAAAEAKAQRDAAAAEQAKAQAERDKLQAQLEAERQAAADKAAAEAKAQKEAAAAAAATAAAEIKAAAKAAAAPDKAKLEAFAAEFRSLKLPSLSSPEGEAALDGIRSAMNTCYKQIKSAISTL